MTNLYVFVDIQKSYLEFLENKSYPKLESLNNWGKNRFFFNQYFRLIEDSHQTEEIMIEHNKKVFRLETGQAPDFMDKDRYLEWLLTHFIV